MTSHISRLRALATSGLARAATTRPGTAALEAVVLARFAVSLRRGALAGALEVARYARLLASRHRAPQARVLLRRAARMMGERPETAVLRLEDCIIELHGEDAALDASVRRTVRATQEVLDLADQAWAVADDAGTVGLLSSALRAVFHPQRHFGTAGSGLSQDPRGFLAPLRASRAFQEVVRPVPARPREQQAGAAPAGTSSEAVPGAATEEAPCKVLFVSLRNWNFMREVVASYREDDRFEVRCLDLADLPVVPTQESVMAQRVALLRGRGGRPHGLPDQVVTDLAWADTVFVEWASTAAFWASLVVPQLAPQARLLVRAHSYEALTAMPLFIDWSAVSGLVTVSPSIRRLLEAEVSLPSGLEVSTVPNHALLTRFRLPKEAGASRTLAMVGWGSVVKDPAWALDVLELLRREDPSWSLLLIGPDFPEDLPGAAADYAERTTARIQALGESVRITGRTEQVPEHLRGAGVILSCSRREGTHEGLIEGVSSGALPVVRNWPDVAQWGGPAALFPSSWVVETPEEAAARIVALSDDEAYRSRQADWMIEHADWSAVRPLYDALLLGRPGAGAQGPQWQEGPRQ